MKAPDFAPFEIERAGGLDRDTGGDAALSSRGDEVQVFVPFDELRRVLCVLVSMELWAELMRDSDLGRVLNPPAPAAWAKA